MSNKKLDPKELIVKAECTGMIELSGGAIKLPCAVLPGAHRVISQNAMMRALGMTKGGHIYRKRSAISHGGGPLAYLSAPEVQPFVPTEAEAIEVVPYVYNQTGQVAHGVRATALADVCEVWLAARRAGALTSAAHLRTAQAAEIIMSGLARVGIVALVDEATGYQDRRQRNELAKLLEKYIDKEVARWTKTFPTEFLQLMCKLRNVEWRSDFTTPRYFGHLINNAVYSRLAPAVLQELRRVNPSINGTRATKHHQWLTEGVGNPKLRGHLEVCIALMRLSQDWDHFIAQLDRVAPKQKLGTQFHMALPEPVQLGGEG